MQPAVELMQRQIEFEHVLESTQVVDVADLSDVVPDCACPIEWRETRRYLHRHADPHKDVYEIVNELVPCPHVRQVHAEYSLDIWLELLRVHKPEKYRKHFAPRPQPAQSTRALAGSEEKIRVLIERQERGEELFHAQDNRCKVERKQDPLTYLHRGKNGAVYLSGA